MTMIEKTWPITEKLILNALYLTEQLYQQLIQEANTLKKPSAMDLIDAIAANKKQLVIQLEQFDLQCGQLLITEQLPNNSEGIKDYFQRAETAGLAIAEAINNWATIQSLCAECRMLNEQNGASIELLAYHTNRSLHILKGKPQSLNTYESNGSTHSDTFTSTHVLV